MKVLIIICKVSARNTIYVRKAGIIWDVGIPLANKKAQCRKEAVMVLKIGSLFTWSFIRWQVHYLNKKKRPVLAQTHDVKVVQAEKAMQGDDQEEYVKMSDSCRRSI